MDRHLPAASQNCHSALRQLFISGSTQVAFPSNPFYIALSQLTWWRSTFSSCDWEICEETGDRGPASSYCAQPDVFHCCIPQRTMQFKVLVISMCNDWQGAFLITPLAFLRRQSHFPVFSPVFVASLSWICLVLLAMTMRVYWFILSRYLQMPQFIKNMAMPSREIRTTLKCSNVLFPGSVIRMFLTGVKHPSLTVHVRLPRVRDSLLRHNYTGQALSQPMRILVAIIAIACTSIPYIRGRGRLISRRLFIIRCQPCSNRSTWIRA